MNEILKLPHLCDQYTGFGIEFLNLGNHRIYSAFLVHGNAFMEAPISRTGWVKN